MSGVMKMTPTINIQKEVQPHFKRVWQTDCPYILMCGGRNSFKSSTIALLLVRMLIPYIINNDVANIVVIRKVANTIADSVFKKMQWAINKFGLSHYFKTQVHPYRLIHKRTGSAIYFYGQDDFQKLKSNDINNMIAVWYEEAAEFKNAEEFDQTNSTFIRQKHPKAKQVKFFWSWNPPRNPYEWINEWTEKQRDRKGWLVDKSSYLNDELGFVNEQMLEEINSIKDNDYDYYRYLYLGEPVGLGTNIYNMNLFNELQEIPDDDYILGMYISVDTGHEVSATTCSCYALTRKKMIVLLDTYYYSPAGRVNKKSPQELSDDLHHFVRRMRDEYGNKIVKMTIDSAEGALRNQYFKDYGVRWHPVSKLKKVDMIDRVQNLLAQGRFFYLPTKNNLEYFIPQHQKYQWQEETLESDDPKVIKVDDHTCDNFQYVCRDNERDFGLKY